MGPDTVTVGGPWCGHRQRATAGDVFALESPRSPVPQAGDILRRMPRERRRSARRAALWGLCVLAGSLAAATPASAAISWSGPIAADAAGSGPALTAVACPSGTSCTALTISGGAVSFDPSSIAPSSPTPVDRASPLAVTCESPHLCVAVDTSGGEITYDPGDPGAAHIATIDPGRALTAVECPASSACVAVDASGDEVTFDPQAPAAAKVVAIDPGQLLSDVACFAAPSASQPDCVAVDAGGAEVTFNSQTGTASSPSQISFSSNRALTAVICPTSTQCIGFDSAGKQSVFSPAGGNLSQQAFDPGHSIVAVVCPSATSCTAVDSGGAELTFAPGSTVVSRVGLGDPQAITDLACADSAHCMAVDVQGRELSFDPATGVVSPPSLIDVIGSYSAVACVSAAQCTAADQTGNVLTFDPQTGATVASGAVDPGAVTVYALACPSAGQCTLVDQHGNEVSFNPLAPSGPSVRQLVAGHPLLAVSCPSTTQCTAVDDDRDEITFNPGDPSAATYALLATPAQTEITGIACPSTTQCTAVDGAGDEVTFDPQSPGRPPAVQVLAAAAVSVACPSLDECVAVAADGVRATFDPLAAQSLTTATIDPSQPEALACMTATWCVEADAAGNAVEFDPHGPGALATSAIQTAGSLTGIACGSPQACAIVDTTGHAFYGSAGPLPAPPAGSGRPAVVGRAVEGALVSASLSAWAPAPTGYAFQWQRCLRHRCIPIPGAVQRSYRPVAADVGRSLRVLEWASDRGGIGGPGVSAPTRTIAARPQPPSLIHPRLTLIGGARARLSVTIIAARYGPSLSRLLVSLPSGLRLHLRFRRVRHRRLGPEGIILRWRGRRLRFTAGMSHGRLALRLGRPASRAQLELAFPAVSVDRALARRMRAARRRPARLSLAVALERFRARPLRANLGWLQR